MGAGSAECDENVIKSWNREAEYPKQFLTLEAFTSRPTVAFRRRLFWEKPVYSVHEIEIPLRSRLGKLLRKIEADLKLEKMR